MRILVEHPIFVPYQSEITGGTERFVHQIVKALPNVTVFGAADSTLPCIKSSAYSTHWMLQEKSGAKNDTKTNLWYNDLLEASRDFDAVILNTSMSSTLLLDLKYEPLFRKSIYFNHNGSNWFVRGFAGRQMQCIIRFMRSQGGRAFYFSDTNRQALELAWNTPEEYQRSTTGKVEVGLKRLKDHSFLELDMWDGEFNQAVFPDDAWPAREGEGYVVAVGRDVPDKRLKLARAEAKKQNRELFVLSDLAHGDVMEVVSGADCLLLSSRYETFSIAAFEAMCHGVPVSCLETPPALALYPTLAREWGHLETTSLSERQTAQKALKDFSINAFGERLQRIVTSVSSR